MASLILRRSAAVARRLLSSNPNPNFSTVFIPTTFRLSQRSNLCSSVESPRDLSNPSPPLPVPPKTDSKLQDLLWRYCVPEEQDFVDLYPEVVEEILRRRKMRVEEGKVVKEEVQLITRPPLKGEVPRAGRVDEHAETWKQIMNDYVPFSFKRDHGGTEGKVPEKFVHFTEELGEMIVRGDILGDHAFKLATQVSMGMAEEFNAIVDAPDSEVPEDAHDSKVPKDA